MSTRGTVYLVRKSRSDGGWIHYRTCDWVEACRRAEEFGVTVTVAAR